MYKRYCGRLTLSIGRDGRVVQSGFDIVIWPTNAFPSFGATVRWRNGSIFPLDHREETIVHLVLVVQQKSTQGLLAKQLATIKTSLLSSS